MEFYAIIPAAGSGVRFSTKTPKQFIKFNGKELIIHTLEKFEAVKRINSIVISTKLEYFNHLYRLIRKHRIKKVTKIIEGGKTRQESVFNALQTLRCKSGDRIIIHDSVRPFVTPRLIMNLIRKCESYNCIIPGLRITDTIKKTDSRAYVVATIQRDNVWQIQTPQLFRFDELMNSFKNALNKNFIGTDEASLLEFAGYKVKIIEGEKSNIKITVKEDLKKI